MNVAGHIRVVVSLVAFLSLVGMIGCATDSETTVTPAKKNGATSNEKKMLLPLFELPVPADKAAQEYLGISGSGTFKITDIQANVVIVEVFNMYCPHCQKEAPNVNKLYEVLQEDQDLKNSMKLIGIGTGNTPFEIDLFREKYGVVFPLFPDQDMSVGRMLGVRGTPTFIGIKISPDGTAHDFYFETGKMGTVEEFLDKMMSTNEE